MVGMDLLGKDGDDFTRHGRGGERDPQSHPALCHPYGCIYNLPIKK